MHQTDPETFLSRVGPAGISVDPEWAHNWPRNLTFLSSSVEDRYWVVPPGLRSIERFVADLLDALGDWSSLSLWPKSPGWLAEIADESTYFSLLAPQFALPQYVNGSLDFASTDRTAVSFLIALTASYGWSWAEDIFVVPDSRDVILMVDHHHTVWAQFREQSRCDRFVEDLRKAGWELPTSPPDSTFKSVSWMQ